MRSYCKSTKISDININEPHAGGGNPVLAIGESSEDVMFNDILGTSLGVVKDGGYSAIDKTSFGADSTDKSSFFTGKPYIEDLGYAFLFRNYRADLGKWQMRDLIGYPDGWNNLAYCGNKNTMAIDYMGAWAIGNDYSINDPNTPYGTVLDTRTPERDMSLAQNAYEYFLLKKAYLSASLVNYVMASTEVQNSNGYDVGDRYSEEIISDNGFNSVRNFVKNIMNSASIGQTVTFNHRISTTLISSYDLAKSIHGVTFTITGTIYKGSDPWSGMLNISYSDPYDFKSNDPDWKVRVFGRLYENGWITKFNVKGNFYAEFNE